MGQRHVDHLLIGGGLASANCARHLRENSDDSILIVGREPEPPYNRPALTKSYLTASKDRAIDYFRPPGFWEEQGIEVLTKANVMRLDPVAREATLADKQVVSYGNALLATGANVNLLRVPGIGHDGVHYLRAAGNSDAILEDIERLGRRVTLIGGSYIGCEVAATLAGQGCECSIVMLEELPLQRTLGELFGRWTLDHLQSLGVRLHPGEALASFESEADRVTRVVCESGLKIECDLVVIGAGVHPDTTLARQAGLEIGEAGGILTDSQLRTSAQNHFAAGDVAEWYSSTHQRQIRVEHWDVAFNQGRTAALNMLGGEVAHDVVPYFWSDLGDVEIESVGPAYSWDREILRGRLEDGAFSVWFVDGARVAQVAAIDRGEDLDTARKLLTSRKELSAEQLDSISDPTHDLQHLLQGASARN